MLQNFSLKKKKKAKNNFISLHPLGMCSLLKNYLQSVDLQYTNTFPNISYIQ